VSCVSSVRSDCVRVTLYRLAMPKKNPARPNLQCENINVTQY
jgi:hypothetical protein